MDEAEKKTTTERRALILEQLALKGQVEVNSLSKELGVSEVTVRNDLGRLEEKKMLIRARGGAIKLDRVGVDFALAEKDQQNKEEKTRIGQAAAKLIEAGDTIILDSGSTTMEIAKNLQDISDLTVITNALNVAKQLAESKNANVIVPGGFLRKNSLSLVGAIAEAGFRNYFCDKLFLAVDGINSAYGLSTPNVEEAHLNRIMIEISKKVIVVTDSSKFQKKSFAFIASMHAIDVVVTDAGIPPEELSTLENHGVQVIIV